MGPRWNAPCVTPCSSSGIRTRFGKLICSWNSGVAERTAELAKSLNENLQAEIGERKRVEEQLRDVDRRKDHFLATLAHELRNPLSPLTSAAQLIGMEPENTDQVRELTTVMTRQLAQLVRLIDDLLDVSRISGGKLQLRKAQFPWGNPSPRPWTLAGR